MFSLVFNKLLLYHRHRKLQQHLPAGGRACTAPTLAQSSLPVATGGFHRRRRRGGHVDLFGDDLLAGTAAAAGGGGTVE